MGMYSYTDKAAAERFLEDNGFIFRKEREKKKKGWYRTHFSARYPVSPTFPTIFSTKACTSTVPNPFSEA